MPAQSPIRIIDRRSSSGYVSQYRSNYLVQAATQTSDRKKIQDLDRDTHRNITNMGRRTLMTLGRWLFWNFPAIRGAVLEQANLAVETFIPQFQGANKAWGKEVERLLMDWEKICNVQGWPQDGDTMRNSLIVQTLVDGDQFLLLTETTDGYPLIQVHPAHRIGSRLPDVLSTVYGGPWDGYRLIDGVIIDDIGRSVAYRYLGDPYNFLDPIDVPASNMFPVFFPDVADQYRGFSGLASCVFDCQDVKESRWFELLAQKVGAAISLIERNESGEADETKAIIQSPTVAANATTGAAAALSTETFDGGMVRYFRSNTGSGLEAFKNDRPSANQQAFEDRVMQAAFSGMEWSKDFSLDPSKVGGAQMRVVIEKVNFVLRKRRKMISKAMRRVHGYAIAKFIKLGLINFDPEWYRFTYQGPGELTADKKYDSDVDLQEYRAGFTTLDNVTGARGGFWEDVQDQKIAERKRLEEQCKIAGIDPEKIEILTPNGNIQQSSDGGAQNDKSTN